MTTAKETNNLFVRVWRRIRDFDTTPQNTINREGDQRDLAEAIIADLYRDVLSKVMAKFSAIDLDAMDPITLEVKIPDEMSPKFIAVKPVKLKPFLDALLDESSRVEAKPYQAYDSDQPNEDEEQAWQ